MAYRFNPSAIAWRADIGVPGGVPAGGAIF